MASENSGYALRLCEDTLGASGRCSLLALNRVLYVRRGALVAVTGAREVPVLEDQAWYGAEACEVGAGGACATGLRYELTRGSAPVDGPGSAAKVLLEHTLDLDPRAEYLMRADRVDFAPGGVALPHRHRGGGIRCLIAGALDVTVGQTPARRGTPGGAWFESGRGPVLAVASKDEPTSFVRVAIPPRKIRVPTPSAYVHPIEAERG